MPLVFGVHGEALEVATSGGTPGDRVAGDARPCVDSHPAGRGRGDGVAEAAVVEAPELAERRRVDPEDLRVVASATAT